MARKKRENDELKEILNEKEGAYGYHIEKEEEKEGEEVGIKEYKVKKEEDEIRKTIDKNKKKNQSIKVKIKQADKAIDLSIIRNADIRIMLEAYYSNPQNYKSIVSKVGYPTAEIFENKDTLIVNWNGRKYIYKK